jgi:AcrR family transcriptional regulator
VRTRAALRQALISLILERGWDAIGIHDICQRAKIGRSTFYTHFADKEELLLTGFDELRRALRMPRSDGSPEGLRFARGLLEHAHENRRLFRALVGKRSSLAVQRRFLQLIVELLAEELGARDEPTLNYLAGALFQLVFWWLEARKPLPPLELDALFQRLSAPVLAAARAARASGSGRSPAGV